MLRNIESVLIKIPLLFTTVFGWLLISFSSLLTVVSPHKYSFSIVVFVVMLDLIWGIAAAITQKRFAMSEAARETTKKLAIYASMLIPIILIEKILGDNWFIAIKLSCALAAACELWSVSANMLIVKPNMAFLRIFRLQLKGEIEKKTGINTDEILFNSEKFCKILKEHNCAICEKGEYCPLKRIKTNGNNK